MQPNVLRNWFKSEQFDDMEHTHLVKALDYVLLQKVRGEIIDKEQ